MNNRRFDELAGTALRVRPSRRRFLQIAAGALAALGISRAAGPPSPVLANSTSNAAACEALARVITQINARYAGLIQRFPRRAAEFEAQRAAVVGHLQAAMQHLGCSMIGPTGSAYQGHVDSSVDLGAFEPVVPNGSGPAGPRIGPV